MVDVAVMQHDYGDKCNRIGEIVSTWSEFEELIESGKGLSARLSSVKQ